MGALRYAGYILAAIGGVVLIIFGILWIIASPFEGIFAASVIAGFGTFATGVVWLILGIVALAGARWTYNLVWGIVLVIVGLIAGGIGGGLVVLGAILGLISGFVEKDRAPPPKLSSQMP